MDHTVKYAVKQVRLDKPPSERFTREGWVVQTWWVWPLPALLRGAHLSPERLWIRTGYSADFCFYVVAQRQNHPSQYLTASFCSPLKDGREKNGWSECRGWGGGAGEQVLFLWPSASWEEEVKTFSPLITRETTWRLELNSVRLHEVISRKDLFIVQCHCILQFTDVCVCVHVWVVCPCV